MNDQKRATDQQGLNVLISLPELFFLRKKSKVTTSEPMVTNTLREAMLLATAATNDDLREPYLSALRVLSREFLLLRQAYANTWARIDTCEPDLADEAFAALQRHNPFAG